MVWHQALASAIPDACTGHTHTSVHPLSCSCLPPTLLRPPGAPSLGHCHLVPASVACLHNQGLGAVPGVQLPSDVLLAMKPLPLSLSRAQVPFPSPSGGQEQGHGLRPGVCVCSVEGGWLGLCSVYVPRCVRSPPIAWVLYLPPAWTAPLACVLSLPQVGATLVRGSLSCNEVSSLRDGPSLAVAPQRLPRSLKQHQW